MLNDEGKAELRKAESRDMLLACLNDEMNVETRQWRIRKQTKNAILLIHSKQLNPRIKNPAFFECGINS
jgi:hypothetical protein